MHFPGAETPINGRQLLGKHGSVGKFCVILLDGLQLAFFEGFQSLLKHIRSEGGEPVVQLAGGLILADLNLTADEHIARVKPLIHLHRGNARHLATVYDRPLNGRRAPELRQQ